MKSINVFLPKKSDGEAANPVAAAAAKWPKCNPGCCNMAGTRCGRIGLVAAELELELGEAGESERFVPPMTIWLVLLLLLLLLILLLLTADLEPPKILSIVNREAAAAAAVAVPAAGRCGRSSSMMVAPDCDPSSEEGVCDWGCWCCWCWWCCIWFCCCCCCCCKTDCNRCPK